MGLTLSVYGPQGVFFVVLVGVFARQPSPVTSVGRVFLLSTVPFLITSFFLVHFIDRFEIKKWLSVIKFFRVITLALLGLGLFFNVDKVTLFYASVLSYDLFFFLYQSASGRLIKDCFQRSNIRLAESWNMVGIQTGMAFGGVLAGESHTSLAWLILGAAFIEAVGFIIIPRFQSFHVPKEKCPQEETSVQEKTSVSFFDHTLFFLFFALILLLPARQILNVWLGVWTHAVFLHPQQRLGWAVFGMSAGALCASLSLAVANRLRESSFLYLTSGLAVFFLWQLYLARTLPELIIFSALFSMTVTYARISLRGSYIVALPATHVHSSIMIVDAVSVALSLALLAFISYGWFLSQAGVFVVLFVLTVVFFLLAFMCFLLRVKKRKSL